MKQMTERRYVKVIQDLTSVRAVNSTSILKIWNDLHMKRDGRESLMNLNELLLHY
jgi:hypothetical protein